MHGFQDLLITRDNESPVMFQDWEIPRLSMTVNFVGAPALPLSEYRNYSQNLIVGASFQVYMPLSQYDPEKLVNIGTNRFTFKPELGISKAFGRLSLELATGIAFFTANDDFYGGKTRSQAPITSIQGHAVYGFKGGIWVAFDANFYWGGRTTVDGVTGQRSSGELTLRPDIEPFL